MCSLWNACGGPRTTSKNHHSPTMQFLGIKLRLLALVSNIFTQSSHWFYSLYLWCLFYLHLLAFLNHIIIGVPIFRGSEMLLSIGSNLSLWIAVASLRWTQGLLGLWLTMRNQSHLVILEVVAVLIFGRGVCVWETALYQNMLVRWRDLVILCL